MCGEKSVEIIIDNRCVGSPPRVRGEAGGKSKIPIGQRITPACAGRSPVVLCVVGRVWDHPRVCGEKRPAKTHRNEGVGSPPRVRGEGDCLLDVLNLLGITPACAGRRASDYSPEA